jgi:hypothetical protein
MFTRDKESRFEPEHFWIFGRGPPRGRTGWRK